MRASTPGAKKTNRIRTGERDPSDPADDLFACVSDAGTSDAGAPDGSPPDVNPVSGR